MIKQFRSLFSVSLHSGRLCVSNCNLQSFSLTFPMIYRWSTKRWKEKRKTPPNSIYDKFLHVLGVSDTHPISKLVLNFFDFGLAQFSLVLFYCPNWWAFPSCKPKYQCSQYKTAFKNLYCGQNIGHQSYLWKCRPYFVKL